MLNLWSYCRSPPTPSTPQLEFDESGIISSFHALIVFKKALIWKTGSLMQDFYQFQIGNKNFHRRAVISLDEYLHLVIKPQTAATCNTTDLQRMAQRCIGMYIFQIAVRNRRTSYRSAHSTEKKYTIFQVEHTLNCCRVCFLLHKSAHAVPRKYIAPSSDKAPKAL